MERFAPSTAIAAVLAASLCPVPPAAAETEILIGTGPVGGANYRLGRAICRLVNVAASGVRCEALETTGPLFNLGNVRGGALEFGIAPSDWHYEAVTGTGRVAFMDTGFENLRSVFSAHGEPFTLVVRRDAGIGGLEDLAGKRVNIGSPGSGPRATMELVMQAMGWTDADFQLAEALPADQQSLALCHGRVHAAVYAVAHPDPSIARITNLCDATIVDVDGPEIDRLIEDRPYYATTRIPQAAYESLSSDVTTFGVRATLVTASDVEDELVYAVVRAVFSRIDRLRRMHPALGTLAPRSMIREGLTAPLHEGAARYYRERGLH